MRLILLVLFVVTLAAGCSHSRKTRCQFDTPPQVVPEAVVESRGPVILPD